VAARSTGGSPKKSRGPTAPPPDFAGEDLLSVTEAAELTGVPRSTMALWVRSGRFPRAATFQLGKVRAAWYVPITDLIAAGLVTQRRAKAAPLPRVGRLELQAAQRRADKLTRDVADLRAEVERLTLLTREQQAIITRLRRRLASEGSGPAEKRPR
jgi:excisionase family DNA binding protein